MKTNITKKYITTFIGLILYFLYNNSFAEDGGVFGKKYGDELKKGDEITLNMIPNMIKNAIEFFIGIAGTIAIIFIIIGAYKILFGSLQQDKTKGKDTIIMAIGGFIIAALAWFIVQFIFDNFG